ncbi:hypothetical protein [Funiculus sociatus]
MGSEFASYIQDYSLQLCTLRTALIEHNQNAIAFCDVGNFPVSYIAAV